MKNLNNDVFLNKISERIKNGDFDVYMIFPFMSRELLFTSIKNNIKKKILTGGTPILNDIELKDCISEVKELAANIIAIYLKFGFIVRTDTGFEFTKLGKTAIRVSRTI